MRLTDTQRRVLEWLLAYPHVHLTAYFSGDGVRWSHWWRDEAAYQHMRATVPVLGLDASETDARTNTVSGGTPRCTVSTFRALQRRGLLRMLQRGRSSARYTIGRAGVAAIRPLPAEVRA